jgi:hypothetical protein
VGRGWGGGGWARVGKRARAQAMRRPAGKRTRLRPDGRAKPHLATAAALLPVLSTQLLPFAAGCCRLYARRHMPLGWGGACCHMQTPTTAVRGNKGAASVHLPGAAPRPSV